MKNFLAQLRAGLWKVGAFPHRNVQVPRAALFARSVAKLRSRQAVKSLLKAGQYLCLFVAILCLGTVVLAYVRSSLVQSYESRRLDRALGRGTPSQNSGVSAWLEHSYSALMEKAGAKFERNQASSPSLDRVALRLPAASPALPAGSLIGRLEISKLGLSVMVLEGDDDEILAEAAGHVPSTALPGGLGNVAVAGHRDTFFRALRNIHHDDVITFATAGGTYEYRVESLDTVKPQDVQVLDASAHPTLTLITCYPFDYIGAAPLRFVVKASEIGSSHGTAPERLLARHDDGQDPLFAHTFPGADVNLSAHAKNAVGREGTPHSVSYRLSAERHSIPIAPLPGGNSPRETSSESAAQVAQAQAPPPIEAPVAKHSERVRNTSDESGEDPSPEPAAHSHKKLRKVRAWLAYIPRHLK